MFVKVEGYSQIHSNKNNKDYTIVYCLTDVKAGQGFQNEKFIFEGHFAYELGSKYAPVFSESLQNGRVIQNVTGLVKA